MTTYTLAMRLPFRPRQPVRRAPRVTAFRSTDLVARLRDNLSPWLAHEGFRRLGNQAWVRRQGDDHNLIAVQCRQSGWDRYAGNEFIVEFELAASPRRATGYSRSRIWSLLTGSEQREAFDLINAIALTLPSPDQAFLATLPPDVRDHYLRPFTPPVVPVLPSDVWFRYYDEYDAELWAAFLSRSIAPALNKFLTAAP